MYKKFELVIDAVTNLTFDSETGNQKFDVRCFSTDPEIDNEHRAHQDRVVVSGFEVPSGTSLTEDLIVQLITDREGYTKTY